MSYSVLITDNETKQESVMLYEYNFDNDFWWSEGNFSCDCNRGLEFKRGLGENPDMDETSCGNGKYSVSIYDCSDGSLLYSEVSHET